MQPCACATKCEPHKSSGSRAPRKEEQKEKERKKKGAEKKLFRSFSFQKPIMATKDMSEAEAAFHAHFLGLAIEEARAGLSEGVDGGDGRAHGCADLQRVSAGERET